MQLMCSIPQLAEQIGELTRLRYDDLDTAGYQMATGRKRSRRFKRENNSHSETTSDRLTTGAHPAYLPAQHPSNSFTGDREGGPGGGQRRQQILAGSGVTVTSFRGLLR